MESSQSFLCFEGQLDTAAALLREVADAPEAQTLKWDPRDWASMSFWPPEPNFCRRSLFALALIHDLAGRRDAAKAIYDALKKESAATSQPVTDPTAKPAATPSPLAPWLDLFLAEPYTGHPDQYLKGLVR